MKKYTILFCCLFMAKLYGQKYTENLLCSPVLVSTGNSNGSGCFVGDSNYIYFVTAAHVVYDVKTNSFYDSIVTLKYYPHNLITDTALSLSINIRQCWNKGNVRIDVVSDILVFKIADYNAKDGLVYYFEYIQKKTQPRVIHPINIKWFSNYEDVHLGDDIVLSGYPSSIGIKQLPQYDFSRPLLRKGIIAGKYDKQKTIVIDCPSYFGNSGGPVFCIYEDNAKFLGIVSEYIPYVEYWEGQKSKVVNTEMYNSGYTIIQSAQKIKNVILNFK